MRKWTEFAVILKRTIKRNYQFPVFLTKLVYRHHSRKNVSIFTRFPFGVKTMRTAWGLTESTPWYGWVKDFKETYKNIKKYRYKKQSCLRYFQENIYWKYPGNRKNSSNQPISGASLSRTLQTTLPITVRMRTLWLYPPAMNLTLLPDCHDTSSLDEPTPHKFLTTFGPFLAMFIRTALKVRQIIKYGNAKFPENEATDYLKHSTSSFLSFRPFAFFHPLLFHFSLPSHVLIIVLADYETTCVLISKSSFQCILDRPLIQRPLGSIFILCQHVFTGSKHTVSSSTLCNRVTNLKIASSVSIPFFFWKIQTDQVVLLYSSVFMYRPTYCNYLWTSYSFGYPWLPLQYIIIISRISVIQDPRRRSEQDANTNPANWIPNATPVFERHYTASNQQNHRHWN